MRLLWSWSGSAWSSGWPSAGEGAHYPWKMGRTISPSPPTSPLKGSSRGSDTRATAGECPRERVCTWRRIETVNLSLYLCLSNARNVKNYSREKSIACFSRAWPAAEGRDRRTRLTFIIIIIIIIISPCTDRSKKRNEGKRRGIWDMHVVCVLVWHVVIRFPRRDVYISGVYFP